MKKWLLWIGWGIFSGVLGLLLAEGVAQLYVYHIARRGKLIQPDPVLGWKYLPNLDIQRLNSDGQLWRIQTNQHGYRTVSAWSEQATTRILILGDSFAFGEGINEEDRFDTIMASEHPSWAFMNLGVMAYGTDQELLAGNQFFQDLKSKDIVLLLTYFNDYIDILRQKFAGRAKPWFDHHNGQLIIHQPAIGFCEILRDKLYLFAKIMSFLEPELYTYSVEEVTRGVALYQAIVQYRLQELLERGVFIVIAHHGEELLCRSLSIKPEFFGHLFSEICSHPKISCVSLDEFLRSPPTNPRIFLSDGHWNPNGHKRVAQVLHNHLVNLK